MKWKKDDVQKAIYLYKLGKNYKEIALELSKTHDSVTKKLVRLGFKGKRQLKYVAPPNKDKTKYVNINWLEVQKDYDNGLTYDDLLKRYKLGTHAIIWAKKNKVLILRKRSETRKLLYRKGKYKKSLKQNLERYRQLCKFSFSLKDFPDEFDFSLIEKYGWYSASNRGNNLDGVSRDHIFSVKQGYDNGILPIWIKHPANCNLMLHKKNSSKRDKSNIGLNDLFDKITHWNNKYGSVVRVL